MHIIFYQITVIHEHYEQFVFGRKNNRVLTWQFLPWYICNIRQDRVIICHFVQTIAIWLNVYIKKSNDISSMIKQQPQMVFGM